MTASGNGWYNKWYNEWYNEWQRVVISPKLPFFRIIWCRYEYLKNKKIILLRQRLLQTAVIVAFKVYQNFSRSSFVLILKVTTCYFLQTGEEGLRTIEKTQEPRTLRRTLSVTALKKTLSLWTLISTKNLLYDWRP